MTGEHVLALDLGTTSVRGLVLRADGAAVAAAKRRLPVAFPEPGRVEQDPEILFDASVEVLRAAIAEGGLAPGDLTGLGLVTQRATVVAWDADTGCALTAAQSWQDQRTAPLVAEWRARGVPMNTMASAGKLAWWLRHEPAVQAAARRGRLRVGTPDAWIGARLAGAEGHTTDLGQAGCTGLLDAATGAWHPAALAFFGIEPDWLPRIVPTSACAAEVDPRLLGAAIPLAARAGDQQAAAFAQGLRRSGAAKLTLGTSAMLDLHVGEKPVPSRDGAVALPLWELEDGTRAHALEGNVITAGAAVEWLLDLGLLPAVGDLDRVAASVADAAGVVFVPALQGLGTPHADETARGLCIGLTRGTSRAHLVRAVLEGIAARCVEVWRALAPRVDALPVDGGLAQSDVLLQLLADGIGVPVERAGETETTARGAAWLAGLASGPTGAAWGELPAGARFAPRAASGAPFAEAFARALARSRGS
ncbi:MAG: glycerol kinase [Proteobacteria bacterium]|nr:glycerol kinase [Pseudomonadota bacterium]